MSELNIPLRQFARTAAQLDTENPILLDKQLVIERDTGKMKLGNGTTAYNSLPYLFTIPTNTNQLTNGAGFITSSALNPYLLSSTAASTYYPLTNPSGFITSAALSGYVQGNGTVNAIPKFTGSGTIGAGVIVDNNTSININIPSGFGIGTGATNRRRIVYGVDAATAFTFLTDSDNYSPIYAGLGSVITAGTATVDSTLLTVQNTNSDGGAIFRILRQNGATGGIRSATVNLNNEWYAGINRNGGNASTQYSISNNLDTTLATTLLRFSTAGLLRLGATSVTPIVTTTGFFIGNNHTGGTAIANINAEGTIQSDVTNSYRGFRSAPSTVASVFTVTDLSHFNASFGMQGVGSVITNQYGFIANVNLTNAVNNYGFYGAIPAGANRWNCYMLGTAANYFAGNLLLGTTVDNGVDRLQVNGNARISGNTTQIGKQEFFTIGTNTGRVSSEIYQDADISNPLSGALYIVPKTSGGRIYFGRSSQSAILNFSGVSLIESMPSLSMTGAIFWGGTSFLINRLNDDMVYLSGSSIPGKGGHRFFSNRENSGYSAPDEIFTITNTGNVLIGTTVDNGIDKLQVNGSARFSGTLRAAQISTTKQTLTPTGTTQTIDWNNGSIIDLVLSSATGNVTLTLLNAQNAISYLIEVTNGATPRNLIFPTGTLQSNGGGNVYVGIANRKDVIAVLWDGNQFLISVSPNYA